MPPSRTPYPPPPQPFPSKPERSYRRIVTIGSIIFLILVGAAAWYLIGGPKDVKEGSWSPTNFVITGVSGGAGYSLTQGIYAETDAAPVPMAPIFTGGVEPVLIESRPGGLYGCTPRACTRFYESSLPDAAPLFSLSGDELSVVHARTGAVEVYRVSGGAPLTIAPVAVLEEPSRMLGASASFVKDPSGDSSYAAAAIVPAENATGKTMRVCFFSRAASFEGRLALSGCTEADRLAPISGGPVISVAP